jgi:hypothetical protein
MRAQEVSAQAECAGPPLAGRAAVGGPEHAAEVVGVRHAPCGGDGLDRVEMVQLLRRLVGTSWVIKERGAVHTRYRMLETSRQYALERLIASSEAERVRDRHNEWFLELAERAAGFLLGGPEQANWFDRVELEPVREALHELAHVFPDAVFPGGAGEAAPAPQEVRPQDFEGSTRGSRRSSRFSSGLSATWRRATPAAIRSWKSSRAMRHRATAFCLISLSPGLL